MFEQFYNEFTKSDLWKSMLSVKEDSPYHREANIAEHTRMCLNWYKENKLNLRDKDQQLITQLAILFHDSGKPLAMVEKENEARGKYKSFAGHELISSKLFENYILSNNSLNLSLSTIRQIKWLIENHLPYDKKDLKNFALDMKIVLDSRLCLYTDLLMSDASGRISDVPKVDKVVEWISALESIKSSELNTIESDKNAYILVGASGSGKSTISKQINNAEIFSLDSCRIQFFLDRNINSSLSEIELYESAWNYCNSVKNEFDSFTNKIFLTLIKENKNIIIDNINISPKSRRRWIVLLKQHNYNIVGFEFMNTLDNLKEHSDRRADKKLKFEIVKQHYLATSLLRYGSEVDEIRLINVGD
jgi:predicted kinase